jgi:DNA-binding transcriptional MerR regulator
LARTQEHYRMRDLVQATGVARSTILFYLSRGLLPTPEKSGPNTALYDPACVERIRIIRRLQAHHRLTLSEIRTRLDGMAAGDPGIRPQPDPNLPAEGAGRKRLRARDFCRETGLEAEQVYELMRAGLLQPLADDLFDQEDVEMGRMYREAIESGIRPGELTFYVELGSEIVSRERALQARETRSPSAHAAAADRRLARMCRSYIIERLSQRRARGLKPGQPEPPPPREREPWLD